MMDKDELLIIVKDELKAANGDKLKAIESLQMKAESNPDMLIGFALYGKEILEAVTESESSVKH